MASLVASNKPGLTVTTTTLSKQSSQQSMDTSILTPSADKSGLGKEMTRESDASTPCSTNHGNPFDTDVEAMISHSSSDRQTRKSMLGDSSGESCQVWPGQEHWKQKAKAAKKQQTCGCLAHLSQRNRILVKILIGLLVVGAAVAVGLGISKPLGAGIWHPKGQ